MAKAGLSCYLRRYNMLEALRVADGGDGPDDGSFSIYMLRTMQQHHVHLSAQADQKASMLIGATAVIMTLIFRDANDPGGVALPLVCVAGASFAAAVLAILAVTPMTKPKANSDANLMFFGGFIGLDEEHYQDRMATIMATNGRIQRAMVRDVYQLGQVLGRRKYKLVTWAYRVFLFGLVGSFALFAAGLAHLLPR